MSTEKASEEKKRKRGGRGGANYRDLLGKGVEAFTYLGAFLIESSGSLEERGRVRNWNRPLMEKGACRCRNAIFETGPYICKARTPNAKTCMRYRGRRGEAAPSDTPPAKRPPKRKKV